MGWRSGRSWRVDARKGARNHDKENEVNSETTFFEKSKSIDAKDLVGLSSKEKRNVIFKLDQKVGLEYQKLKFMKKYKVKEADVDEKGNFVVKKVSKAKKPKTKKKNKIAELEKLGAKIDEDIDQAEKELYEDKPLTDEQVSEMPKIAFSSKIKQKIAKSNRAVS